MSKTGPLIILLFVSMFLSACMKDRGYATCCCFDDEDFAYGFTVDLKSFNKGMFIKEFTESFDSLRKPLHYKILVEPFNANPYEQYFTWHGNGKGDSVVNFYTWGKLQKVTIEVDTIGLKHVFTDFRVEGYYQGTDDCKCFTPTRKTVVMDDSITLDALNKGIHIKK